MTTGRPTDLGETNYVLLALHDLMQGQTVQDSRDQALRLQREVREIGRQPGQKKKPSG